MVLPAREGSRELCWELHGAQFFKMSSLEQRLSRIEEKLKQENEEARRRIDLNIDMSPQRSRPRPSECPPGRAGEDRGVGNGPNSRGKARRGGGEGGKEEGRLTGSYINKHRPGSLARFDRQTASPTSGAAPAESEAGLKTHGALSRLSAPAVTSRNRLRARPVKPARLAQLTV